MSAKDLIWDTALELFMKYGIKSVSMDDLAKTLGMSKKTIYTFISNKEDLVNKVIKQHLNKDEESILKIINHSEDALDAMVSITKHVLLFLRKIKPSLVFDLKKYHPGGWQMIEEQHFKFIEDIIRQNIARGITENLYRKDADPQIIAKLYVAKSRYLVDEDYFPLTEYNREKLLIQMIMYHLNGIISDSGREKLNHIQF